MAAYEVITLVEGTPQLRAPGAGNTYSMPRPLAIAPDAGSALTLTGGTVTTSNPLIDATQTWNAGVVTFTGWKLNITNTASAAASLLMDLQVGGVSQLSVGKTGGITVATTSYQVPAIGTASNTGIFFYSGSLWNIAAGSNTLQSSTTTLDIPLAAAFGWASLGVSGHDTTLWRSAAGVIHVGAATSSSGGALQFMEQTAPSAPAANYVRVYAQDNGAGKTQLMALFGSGAAQQIAIEP